MPGGLNGPKNPPLVSYVTREQMIIFVCLIYETIIRKAGLHIYVCRTIIARQLLYP